MQYSAHSKGFPTSKLLKRKISEQKKSWQRYLKGLQQRTDNMSSIDINKLNIVAYAQNHNSNSLAILIDDHLKPEINKHSKRIISVKESKFQK